jgi:hypothetical protein
MPKLTRDDGGKLVFRCPGCKDTHHVDLSRWTWNGSMDAPTFMPSLSVRAGHFVEGQPPEASCWCTYNKEHHSGMECYICHSFVADGRIQFLSDCTHALAGQTVDIPEWDGWR